MGWSLLVEALVTDPSRGAPVTNRLCGVAFLTKPPPMSQLDSPRFSKSGIDHALFFSDCNEHKPTAPARVISAFNSPARHARFPLPQIIPRRLRGRDIIGAFEHPARLKTLAAFRLSTITSLQNDDERTRRRESRLRRREGVGRVEAGQ